MRRLAILVPSEEDVFTELRHLKETKTVIATTVAPGLGDSGMKQLIALVYDEASEVYLRLKYMGRKIHTMEYPQ
jgi:hypothetical protein